MDLEAVTDEILLVEDEMLIASIGLVFHHHGLVIEPAGAAGLAAIVSHKDRFRGMLVATPLCGGNLTAAQARDWLLKSPDDLQASH